MREHTASRRTRYLRLGAPAAVLGTLAGSLAAAPASADAVAVAASPVERQRPGAAMICPAQSAPPSYVVQPGDTVFDIASRFGIRTADVLAWNGLSWRSVILPGQSLSLTGPASAPAAPQTSTQPATTSHTVVAGDTLFGIAQRYGTTVDALLAANGLTRESVIYPGQALAISGAAAPAAPTATPAPSAPEVVAPAAPAGTGQVHEVAAGDTLFGIAQRYGTTTAALFAANGLEPSSIIYPGQTITVSAAPAPAPAAPPTPAPAGQHAELDTEQAANASHIIRIGRELGVPDRGIAIALATSMVESWMRNLDWGDRDSLGLFQQRPSTGWGTAEQVRDVDRSIRVFYGGPDDPNGRTTRGLLDVAGWESMSFSEAAQAVQISAYPDRYGQWEAQAYQWLALYG